MANNFYTKDTFMGLLGSSEACSGQIQICLPPVSGEGVGKVISGFLANDFTMELGNTWGSVLPDAETANQIGQILGLQNVITWIQSSAAAWKSTQPITFTIDVYLVTVVRNQSPSVLEDAKEIMKMLAFYVDGDNFATAKVHGGYSVDYAIDNRGQFLNLFSRKEDNPTRISSAPDTYSSGVNTLAKSLTTGDNQGTIDIYINNSLHLKNLLLEKASFTHSSAYVNARTPLYVQMSLTFRTFRAPTVKDIENLY